MSCKILKAGYPDNTFQKRETCPHCGCEFTFDSRVGMWGGDTGDVSYCTNNGVPYGEPFVTCPQEGCGKAITVLSDDVLKKIALIKKLLASLGGIL